MNPRAGRLHPALFYKERIRIMKRAFHFVAVATACLCLAGSAVAQQQAPELPQPSPKAKVEQRVGLTDVSVDYSSPGAKGRVIWGGLVPYDVAWRTGANAPTKLTSSKNFTFGGVAVPAGSYALYTIPTKGAWTVLLSNSTEGWGGGYPDNTVVARASVKPVPLVKPRERMTFIFSEVTDDAARLDLEWAKLRVSIPLGFDTKAQAAANIDAAVGDAWRPHFASARFLLENNGDLAKALEYVNASIAIKGTWWNTWVRAQIVAKQGQTADAIATAEKAQQLGVGDRIFEFFKADIAKALEGWKKKKP
jgi:Protein of unknown function (DUF2911)